MFYSSLTYKHVQELNKIDAYKQTKCDPDWLIQFYNKQFLVLSLPKLDLQLTLHLNQVCLTSHFSPPLPAEVS